MATQRQGVERVDPRAVLLGRLPAVPARWVPRERLLRRLDDGVTKPMTLVAALPGYGKTSLVSAWLRHGRRNAVWVTLDPWDDRPDDVLHRILDAARDAGSPGGAPLVHTSTDDVRIDVHHVAEQLLDIEPRPVLVLDDLDALATNATRDVLRHLLVELPRTMPVVLITRADPLYLPLPAWRWSGALTEIRAAELAFREPEAEQYLNGCWELSLAPEVVARVTECTEGWPAALELAAAHLAEGPRPDADLLAGEPLFAADLLRRVLDDPNRSDVEFLLQTSVLDELTTDCCTAVTGVDDAGERLHRLSAEGLLHRIDEPPDGEARYGAGRLLRALLRAELHHRDPTMEHALHARAATALAARGEWAGAVRHARRTGRRETPLELVGDHLLDVIALDGGATFRRAVDRVDGAGLEAHPTVAAAHLALAALDGATDVVEATLTSLEVTDAAPSRLVSAGRLHQARLLGHDVETVATGIADTDDPLYVGTLGAQRGWEGRHAEAASLLRGALATIVARAAIPQHLVLLTDLCWERARAGHLLEVDLLVARAVRLSRALGRRRLPLAIHLSMIQLALDRGDDHTLERRRLAADDLARATGDRQLQLDWVLLAARAEGSAAAAAAALGELELMRAHGDGPAWGAALVRRATRQEASLRLVLGDTDGAIAAAPDLADPVAAVLDTPGERLLRARILEAVGDMAGARRALATLHGMTLPPRVQLEASSTELRLHRAAGDAAGAGFAQQTLHRVARSQGFSLTAAQPRTAQSLSDRRRSSPAGPVTSRTAELGHDLTDRELDVLRSLRSPEPYRELASELGMSVNTLKSHLKAVYRKLRVSSRSEAHALADHLGLL